MESETPAPATIKPTRSTPYQTGSMEPVATRFEDISFWLVGQAGDAAAYGIVRSSDPCGQGIRAGRRDANGPCSSADGILSVGEAQLPTHDCEVVRVVVHHDAEALDRIDPSDCGVIQPDLTEDPLVLSSKERVQALMLPLEEMLQRGQGDRAVWPMLRRPEPPNL
jgi:hypothetical protein